MALGLEIYILTGEMHFSHFLGEVCQCDAIRDSTYLEMFAGTHPDALLGGF